MKRLSSELAVLVESVLLALARHDRVEVLEAIEAEGEEVAWIVKVNA